MRIACFALLALLQQTPDATLPTTGESFLTVQGEGVQVYRCTRQETAFQWVFQSPEAKLLDPKTHRQLGTHSAGPTWHWTDQSSVTGKVVGKTPSPDPTSIPWLLLQAQPDPAHAGVLSKAVWIRRWETHGGNPPQTVCDAANAGASLRVPYTATYTFYASATR